MHLLVSSPYRFSLMHDHGLCKIDILKVLQSEFKKKELYGN